MADKKEKQKAIFTKKDSKKRTVLMPNMFPEFSQIMKVAIERNGYKAGIFPFANEEAVELGKRYVHNDICFPAQLNVGEVLHGLKNGNYKRDEIAIALGKRCNACRALQYFTLVRKSLDESGYSDIPIVTNGSDIYETHPGFRLGFYWDIIALQGMLIWESLNEMRQKTLPYEKNQGETEKVFKHYMDKGMDALMTNFRRAKKVLKEAVPAFNKIEIDRSNPKPKVVIIGEILVNYNSVANYGLIEYLRGNDMETILPPISDFFSQEMVNYKYAHEKKFSEIPLKDWVMQQIIEGVVNFNRKPIDKIMKSFRFYEYRPTVYEISKNASEVFDISFNSGEGWLMPGEIIAMIKKGIKSFIIVQPFGCLPNHISGRGLIKAIKEKYNDIQILSLDYDPDISIGNIENRLQMLIMTARELEKKNLRSSRRV